MQVGGGMSFYSFECRLPRTRTLVASALGRQLLPFSAGVLALFVGPAGVMAAGSEANLSIAFTRSASPASSQEKVTYSVRVANVGPAVATSIKVVNTLPRGVTLSSAGGIGWDCADPVGATVTCTLPTLAAGARASLLGVAVTPPSQGGTFKATATVSAAESDLSPADNTASESVAVPPPAPR